MTILSSAPLQPNVKPTSTPTSSSPAPGLATYQFPAGLSETLRRDLGWTWGYTVRALAEYRRFLLLAASCGHPVTPSRAVDEVWHRHLTFSRDYWECLTPLLPAPLHHEPGLGQADDAERHRRQYAQTLVAYRNHFGEEPPADLWPQGGQHPAHGVVWVGAVLVVLSAVMLTQGQVVPAALLLACVAVLGFASARQRPQKSGNRRVAGVKSRDPGRVACSGGGDSISGDGCDGGSGCGGGCGS